MAEKHPVAVIADTGRPPWRQSGCLPGVMRVGLAGFGEENNNEIHLKIENLVRAESFSVAVASLFRLRSFGGAEPNSPILVVLCESSARLIHSGNDGICFNHMDLEWRR